MPVIRDVEEGWDDRILLVLLPGAHMKAADFRDHSFMSAIRRLGLPVDMIAVDTGVDCYLDNKIVRRLHDEIIAPALVKGVSRVWLAGISLGGLGALLYAKAHREIVEGLLLLAPFIGSLGLINEVEAAGGLRRWKIDLSREKTAEQQLLAWLKDYRPDTDNWPDIRLGFGTDDRFSKAHRLLAAILPPGKVQTCGGGHDWDTWGLLWGQLLQTAPFASVAAARD